MANDESSDHVPTWRDGVSVSHEGKAALSSEQWRAYADDSVVRDFSEIEQMPEPMRSWAREAITRAKASAEARITQREHRQAS